MNYNDLRNYTIAELNKEKRKRRVTMILGLIGLLIILAIVLYKLSKANKFDWTLLLPLGMIVLVYNTKSDMSMIEEELTKRE